MLRFLFRRLLWVVPAIAVVSLVLFYLLIDTPAMQEAGGDRGEALRQQRLSQLPLFINLTPRDVTSAANAAVDAIVSDDAERNAQGRSTLVRLGGAALPQVIPHLDTLSPNKRTRVALALAPVAVRAGLSRAHLAADPKHTVLYWTRFWQSHGVEFREATARSAVARFSRYGTDARASELRLLDTFTLPYLMEALPEQPDAGDIVAVRRIVGVMAAATERDARLPAGANAEQAEVLVAAWRRWWRVHAADYRPLVGTARAAGMITETRYAQWMMDAAAALGGHAPADRAFVVELRLRLVTTAAVTLLGLALAYLMALPLGAIAALRRRRRVDRMITVLVMLPYVLTPIGLGLLSWRLGAPVEGSWWRAAVLLAAAMLADPTRQLREQMQRVLVADYIDALVARGATPLLIMWHALRNALAPVLMRISIELPMALTACFVLEKALSIKGLGAALLSAARRHDARWLMACGVIGVVVAVLAMSLAELAQALLDPMTRRRLVRTSGGSA